MKCVPRARGDEPNRTKLLTWVEDVFPAPAGMNRGPMRPSRIYPGVFPAPAGMNRNYMMNYV